MRAMGAGVGDNKPAGVTYTSGKPGKERPKHAGYTIWQRLSQCDNWAALLELGLNPDMGYGIGRLFVIGVLTARQASAARLYAEVVGRYDRYHPTLDTDLRRSAASPTYQRTSRGRDDEIERRAVNGTLKEYEKRARRARKAYGKLDLCIPNEVARAVLDDLCLHERAIAAALHGDLAKLLDRIGDKFGFKYETGHD